MGARLRCWTMLVVSVAALTGCSGSESGSSPEEPTPAPVTLSADGLPSAADLPDGWSITFRCPGDDSAACGETERDGERTGVGGDVEAASPAEVEKLSSLPTPVDFWAVDTFTYSSQAEAERELRKLRQDVEEYDGTFRIADEAVEGGTRPGETGEGRVEAIARDGLEGFRVGYATRSLTARSDRPELLVARVLVGQGRVRVSSFVALSAAGRSPGAAEQAADRLVEEYLARID